MTSVRCLLGHHKMRPTKTVTEESHGGAVKTYTNAICLRCKTRQWWNWWPLPEVSVGSTGLRLGLSTKPKTEGARLVEKWLEQGEENVFERPTDEGKT